MTTNSPDLLANINTLIDKKKAAVAKHIDNIALLQAVKTFDWDNVKIIYIGKKGVCTCGCNGKHYKKGEQDLVQPMKRMLEVIGKGAKIVVVNNNTVSVNYGSKIYFASLN